jgi:hypothetical protein
LTQNEDKETGSYFAEILPVSIIKLGIFIRQFAPVNINNECLQYLLRSD